jgi:pyruvate/2-oxoglutarate/acetoin dehydrogenase E1 component/TPP-dependent pyruvate/acetoin dehydrogenase alpha subunit
MLEDSLVRVPELTQEKILQDYRIAFRSRHVSLVGRREVMSGKAKFGIFGDGKELVQIAMAKVFRHGDFRSGYYRDQTLMFTIGATSFQEFFAQLYANPDVDADPASAGRAMNAHFATRSLNPDGSWKNLIDIVNSSADVSPTGSQMPRLVGLAYASRLYREIPELRALKQFSVNGNEIAFGTIGNATTAEGMFWEALNAIGVLHAPALISIYDDNFGISVSNEHQIVKQDLSELLKGFHRDPGSQEGFDIYTVKGWDYPALLETYLTAAEIVRQNHIPTIIHVIELTQPQGHSTSGSQERYKTKERLEWEQAHDCLVKFRHWILENGYATDNELRHLEAEDQHLVEESRRNAWNDYISPIHLESEQVSTIIDQLAQSSQYAAELSRIKSDLRAIPNPYRRDIHASAHRALMLTRYEDLPGRLSLVEWIRLQEGINEARYSSSLFSQASESLNQKSPVPPSYSEESLWLHGHEILNACFDAALARDPRVLAFGEDVGKLGDVNQGFRGLQAKYGQLRVADTGIRETTIIGQAIGLAMRGLRPIAEIQYLDYVLYALQIMSDDLATLHWRTKGGQKAPVIIRTRGHRLEGIWHSGSLMAGIIHLVRGMHVLVPRNMTQAAGFYNTLLQSDDPALVVEVLNAYRIKERLPDNIGEFTLPLGVPEVLRPGTDISIITYGACCRIVMEAASLLSQVGIEAEVIDVQSLLPFDTEGRILESLKKTNRILFVDEDVPGGTTAYMLQKVIEEQEGYFWLDSPPRTLSGKPHRPAYGSDGDYWSKPNIEQVFNEVYEIFHDGDPANFPIFLK